MGILHDVVAKIKQVYDNWHGVNDPAMTIRKYTDEFMEKAADLVHGLEEQLSLVTGEAGGALKETLEGLKQEVAGLTDRATEFVTGDAHSSTVDEVQALKQEVANLTTQAAEHEATLEHMDQRLLTLETLSAPANPVPVADAEFQGKAG